MENNDTIQLLKECDSGTKMAVSSIDEVSDKINNPQLKQILQKSKEKHTILGNTAVFLADFARIPYFRQFKSAS